MPFLPQSLIMRTENNWDIVVRHALRSVKRDLQYKYKLREYAIIIRRGTEKWASMGKFIMSWPPPPFAKGELVQPPCWSLDNFYYPTSPHTKYNVTVDVEKLENRLRCLLSDNPACAWRSLREEYKPKPHDDRNIRPCKREANRILDKLHAITENITKHDDSLFTEGGKPKTGLNCLHNFNNEKRHYIKSGVEKDVLHLVED